MKDKMKPMSSNVYPVGGITAPERNNSKGGNANPHA